MITIWPQYLNENLSLKEGRKISKEDAVKDPSMNEIEKARRLSKREEYTPRDMPNGSSVNSGQIQKSSAVRTADQ